MSPKACVTYGLARQGSLGGSAVSASVWTSRLVPSRYLRVLWGEKIGYEDGLRRAGCPRIQSSQPTKHINSDCLATGYESGGQGHERANMVVLGGLCAPNLTFSFHARTSHLENNRCFCFSNGDKLLYLHPKLYDQSVHVKP